MIIFQLNMNGFNLPKALHSLYDYRGRRVTALYIDRAARAYCYETADKLVYGCRDSPSCCS